MQIALGRSESEEPKEGLHLLGKVGLAHIVNYAYLIFQSACGRKLRVTLYQFYTRGGFRVSKFSINSI